MRRAETTRIEGTNRVQAGCSNGVVNAVVGGHMATPRSRHWDPPRDECPIHFSKHSHPKKGLSILEYQGINIIKSRDSYYRPLGLINPRN